MSDTSDWIAPFIGAVVVIDCVESYILIGRLEAVGVDHLSLSEVDMHDHREANSTKDVYLIETKRFGVRANRTRVDLPRRNLVAISRLDDIVLP